MFDCIAGIRNDARVAEAMRKEIPYGRQPCLNISHIVRIIGTPPGEAPLWVREAWRGLRLPVCDLGKGREPHTDISLGVISGTEVHDPGFVVPSLAAIRILSTKAPEAANWWEENLPHFLSPERTFLFHADVCLDDKDERPLAVQLAELLRAE